MLRPIRHSVSLLCLLLTAWAPQTLAAQAAADAADHKKELQDEVGGFYVDDENDRPKLVSSASKELNFWLQHGNMAGLLGMKPYTGAKMKVPLNLVFVGFEGDGNHGFDMSEVELKPWFAHLDEAIAHSIVPSLTDFSRSHQINESMVSFQYDFRVHTTHPSVRKLIDTIIQTRRMKEDAAPLYPGAPAQAEWFVEAWRVSDVLGSLTEFLGLNQTYTVFVLNPNPPTECASQPCYGYRSGLATSDLHEVERKSGVRALNDKFFATWYEQTRSSVYHTKDAEHHEWGAMSRQDKVLKQYGSLRGASEAWAGQQSTQMSSQPSAIQEADDAAEAYEQQIQQAHMLEGAAWERTMEEMSWLRLRSGKHNSLHADCLVDNWAGRHRVSFLDLTAGPFQWGPLVGGEGVRSNRTLPRVPGDEPRRGVARQVEKPPRHVSETPRETLRPTSAPTRAKPKPVAAKPKPKAKPAAKPKTVKPQAKPAAAAKQKAAVIPKAAAKPQAKAAAKPKAPAPGKPKTAATAGKPKANAAGKPKAKAAGKPKPQKPAAKPQAKAAAKPAAKPAVGKPQAKPAAKPAAKPKPKAKPAAKPKAKTAATKPKAKAAAKLKAKKKATRRPTSAPTRPHSRHDEGSDDDDEGMDDDYARPAGRRLLRVMEEPVEETQDEIWDEDGQDGANREMPEVSSVASKQVSELQRLFEENHCDQQRLSPKQRELCSEIIELIEQLEESTATARGRTEKKASLFDDQQIDTVSSPDGMLATLGAALHTTIHHLITPSSFTLPKLFPHRVFFHLYVINVDNSPPVDFHAYYNEYKRELLKMQLPSQEFAFSLHRLSMAEDTELALAYSNALRSATVPTLSVDGVFTPTTRMYLDAASLQHNLQVLQSPGGHGVWTRFEKHASDGPQAHTSPLQNSQEVPVFLFYQDQRQYPVLIDVHHQSKALSDMVMVVRSDGEWESVFACNGRPVNWNLENPLRPLLSATVQHLAGVIPTHLTFSEADQRTSQDWLWSVGDNPLAYTSSRWHLTQNQIDTVHRNYVLGGLEAAHKKMNDGYTTLAGLRLTAPNYMVLGTSTERLKKAIQLWMHYSAEQRSVLQHAADLDFHQATVALQMLEGTTTEFESITHQLKQEFSKYDCVVSSVEGTADWRHLVGGRGAVAVLSCVLLGLCMMLLMGNKVEKPKIN